MPTQSQDSMPSPRHGSLRTMNHAELEKLLTSLWEVYRALGRFFRAMRSSDVGEEQDAQEKFYTLSEVSERTGISMPTLQRYRKIYQSRIPSVGTARKRRYPESALPVFDELRKESPLRRGRRSRGTLLAAGPKRPQGPFSHPPGEGPKEPGPKKPGSSTKKAITRGSTRGRK